MVEHKSEKMKATALSNGWKAGIVTKLDAFEVTEDIADIEWHLYAKREHEALHIAWRGNKMESGLYTYGDYRRKLWWKTEVLKVIEGQPDPAKFRTIEKQFLTPEEMQEVRIVPWEDDTPAVDIMLKVINRKVKWHRKLDGEICEAVVDVNLAEKASAKHFRVYTTSAGRRVLEWADTHGFHAVGLDQIISVE